MTVTTAAHTEQGVQFSLLELDLLSTYAGKRPPFPLRVPSFGRIDGERDALFAPAGRALSERGLATEVGPVGVAADLVAGLREHRSAVDLVVANAGTVAGAVAMIHGSRAIVCRQSLGGTPGPITVTRVTAAGLTHELANPIPETKAAPALPITLPPGVVGDATRLLENAAGGAAGRKRVRALALQRGGDPDAVDALIDLVPPVSGRGQLGTAIRRTGGPIERPLELSWLDSPKGRFRVDTDAGGWVSINPLRHNELIRMLREAAALARG